MAIMEQAKKKKIEIKTVSEIYGTTLNEPTFTLQESQKQKRGRKDQMCIEIIAESFPGLGKEPNAHIHRGIIGHINVSMQKTFSNTHV